MLNQVHLKGIMLSEPLAVMTRGAYPAVRLSVTTSRVVRAGGRIKKTATHHYVLVVGTDEQRRQLLQLAPGAEIEAKGRLNQVLMQERPNTDYRPCYLIEATSFVKVRHPETTPA